MYTFDEIYGVLERIIAIPSVKGDAKPTAPFGEDIARCLEEFLAIAREMGFSTKNCGHYGYVEMGEGEEMLGILAHLDVVPAGTGWSVPAYEATIIGDTVYGRGVVDDKGPAICALFAMREICERGINLSKRIRLILGCDEESSWQCMEAYKANEEIPTISFTPDGDYPVIFSEKGIIDFVISGVLPEGFCDLAGGTRRNVVAGEFSCQLNGENYSFSGKNAHGSTPELGINAINTGMRELGVIDANNSLINFYNQYLQDLDGSALGIGCHNAELGSSSLNIGVINSSAGRFNITVNYRYPFGENREMIIAQLEALALQHHYSIDILTMQEPLYVPQDSFLITSLMEVLGNIGSPMAIGGGTYAKAFPNAVAFGVMHEGYAYNIHDIDENTPKQEIMENVENFIKAIEKLAVN